MKKPFFYLSDIVSSTLCVTVIVAVGVNDSSTSAAGGDGPEGGGVGGDGGAPSAATAAVAFDFFAGAEAAGSCDGCFPTPPRGLEAAGVFFGLSSSFPVAFAGRRAVNPPRRRRRIELSRRRQGLRRPSRGVWERRWVFRGWRRGRRRRPWRVATGGRTIPARHGRWNGYARGVCVSLANLLQVRDCCIFAARWAFFWGCPNFSFAIFFAIWQLLERVFCPPVP